MKISENAMTVLERRYLSRDDSGKVVEKPEDMFRRVAKNIASAEANYGQDKKKIKQIENKFYNLMADLDFLPNSPTLMNAGKDIQQLSACFVLPIGDSMESIFDSLKNAAMIHKSGGGTGFSFSRLRPKNDPVMSTSGVSSGPVSFMKVFNAATEAIKQGGTRRGANMGILRVDHPDIMEFIGCKEDLKILTNFNISVAVTDKFMKAAKKDGDYDLVNPRTGKPQEKKGAKEVFDKIASLAWKTGDPGMVFIDRINEFNPTPGVGEVESTNPCGEQPLLPYESCNLGSINLSNMLKDGEVDWDKLRDVVHLAVRFLDDVIDVNEYPLTEISEMTLANRKIGLGIMGWADILILLNMPYESTEAYKFAKKLMKFIQDEGWKASEKLAQERGTFPNFDKSIFKDGRPVRNATVTTIAPTGTISMIADCSSGIEPIYSIAFVKTVMDNDALHYVHPFFKQICEERGIYTDELEQAIVKLGSTSGIPGFPSDLRALFMTAHEISPEGHVKMQAAFQKHIDNAVSKTVNLNEDATIEDIANIYMLAYEQGCKGITVYRDGCRAGAQVLSAGSGEKQKTDAAAHQTKLSDIQVDANGKLRPKARPLIIHGATHRMRTGCGYLYVTINEDNGDLFELFARMGKAGGCAASQTEAIGRLISLALRSGIDSDSIIDQLKGIRCPERAIIGKDKIYSCPDAIGQAIEGHLANKGLDVKAMSRLDSGVRPECPECGGPIEFTEGCLLCGLRCGWSKC
ncbi:MAG: vitamin B12-dependent ribonucleotide reductase [Thermoplasmata archaeon]|nr:vitamin B12-dependent ribonucleotide reductase [Thermoplasmata archaeon]